MLNLQEKIITVVLHAEILSFAQNGSNKRAQTGTDTNKQMDEQIMLNTLSPFANKNTRYRKYPAVISILYLPDRI